MNKPIGLETVAAGDRNAMVDGAYMQVVVSFPATTLSVADTCALRAGHVIDLGVSLAQATMAVQVAGEEIGSGQLMVVGTHAGVMLKSMRS